MDGIRHNKCFRSWMTMLSIVIFLFSYVNATMFWHGHNATGYWVFHSHIAGASHRSAPAESAHTSAELLLVQAVDQNSVTQDVLFSCDLRPQVALLETVWTEPASLSGTILYISALLRGPPALV
ncbi:MAG: hypothetical protein K6G79_05190 [Bacteroidales bacterium]|nr:hypothetical protein [Bacteroidales bacterium]